MAELNPLRRRMIEDMKVRNLSPSAASAPTAALNSP